VLNLSLRLFSPEKSASTQFPDDIFQLKPELVLGFVVEISTDSFLTFSNWLSETLDLKVSEK
jgi:hypothetical protein